MRLNRRQVCAGGAALALAAPFSRSTLVFANDAPWRHGLSLFGDVKYPEGFKHFDYVNPAAPKGGAVRTMASGTFDNLNIVVDGVKGNLAQSVRYIYDTLLANAEDEVSTEYGLLAEAVSHPPDFAWAKFRLRAQARWHDDKPVTPEDVIFSFDALKQHSPLYSAYYRHVVKAEKTGEREITFTFDAPGNRELPMILGQLTVFPKHWWEGTDASGRKRDIGATTLEPPLGGGAYRIKSIDPSRNVVYERVKTYWGKDVNVNIGRDNFDELRFEYFRDTTVALEAFKADQLDFRFESSAKDWATAYDFPAVREKRVVKEEFLYRSVGRMQGFVFNTRRDKFKDARVRLAFNYAFDFEEMNKQMFYGMYSRIGSYFEGTELAWNWRPSADDKSAPATAKPSAESGLPEGEELAILETIRDKLPPEVLTKPFRNPVGGTREAARANLLEATRLLREAGYAIKDRRLVNTKTGEHLTVEFLDNSPSSERMVLFYKPSLERLGIGVTVRTVDNSQYQNRLRSWDFDIITRSWGQSLSPGNEQRDYWGSPAADRSGSRNYPGIKDPAVDALIERIIFAKSRSELVAATRALDRVLMWGHYVVPQFTYSKMRTARWDRFGHPEKMPAYGAASFPSIWWWDAERAAKTGSR